jgi:predicted RNA binding protein YcfA (HicA-like mRNA interferase family)
MKLPRDLSGTKLSRHLCKEWGYLEVHQTGSHIILDTEEPSTQRISVPVHKALRIGTLNSILRAVATHKGVEREDVLSSL